MNLVKNAWYVAGWASEFDQQLSAVKILGEDLVMYRTPKGEVVALYDCCPHKLLPLSMGRLIDDKIECGYHGLIFGTDGKCTHIPSQARVPPSACVRAYPVHERHDIVWVWMGDLEQADINAVFDVPQFSDPNWKTFQGEALYINSNYVDVGENLIDPAHANWVHPSVFGSPAYADVPVECDATGDPIYVWRWMRNTPPNPFFQTFANFKGNVDRWQYLYLHLPSVVIIDTGSADVALGLPEDRRHEGVQVLTLHFLTPVSATETIDRWGHIRSAHVGDDSVTETVNDMLRTAFTEDKPILEATQRQEENPQAVSTVQLAIDRGPLAYRARINQMVELEMDQQSSVTQEPESSPQMSRRLRA